MVQYIYFVKCPGCEDEHFDFFDEARGFAMGCLSKKPIITQTEVCRNDFGECTDSADLGTVWSWEDVMKDTEEPEASVFSKGDLDKYDPDNDYEFANDEDDFRVINGLDEDITSGVAFKSSEEFTQFKKLCDELGIKTMGEVAEFKQLCAELGILTLGDIKNFMQENGANKTNLLAKLREYRADLGPDFKVKESIEEATKLKTWICFYEGRDIGTVRAATKEEAEEQMMIQYPGRNYNNTDWGVELLNPSTEACERKPVPEGMTIEQLVEEMEENEDEVECTWCNDLFPKDMCKKEVNLGWLCSRCADGIMSRGETLTFKENNYWDFLDEKFDIDFEDEPSTDAIDAASDIAREERDLEEGYNPSEEVELYYDDLTITVYGTRRDADDWDEYEHSGEYTYSVRKGNVADTIWENFITEEDVADVPGGLETLEDNYEWFKFLETHFDTLFDKYYNDILKYYEEDAAEEFQDNYEADDDYGYDPDAEYDRWRDEQDDF